MGNSVIRFYEPEGENGYLSNWYLSDFQYAGRKYHSMEQYMMFQKALTFGDLEIADRIMASQSLPEIKKLGRSVAHYNDVLWKTIRVQIMRRGIRAKFQQNPELLYNLMSTGSALLAECATRDLVWGIGLDIDDSRSNDPKEWKGRNLLGRTLMRVREDLRAWCAVAGVAVTQYVDAVDLRTPQPIRVARKNDSEKAERIRRELEQAAGLGEGEAFSADAFSSGFAQAVAGTMDYGSGLAGMTTARTMSSLGNNAADNAAESSVWNMHIYEACMLPYLSEMVATWMEAVFFNLRHSRSYEDLGVSNYTFEELEWMFRSGQSAGLPVAGFFEMKQDIFDLMRYQGGLRNPAALLAQVESLTDGFHETIPSTDTEMPEEAAPESEAAEQYEETHILVDVTQGDNRNRLVGTQDPGRTSAPESYLGSSGGSGFAGEAQAYVPEEGEEAVTSFGSGTGAGVKADDLWNSIRDMENGTAEPSRAEADEVMKTLFATPSEQESEALEETKPEAEFIDTVTEVVDTITEEVVSVTEPAGYAEETAEDIGTEAAESEPEEAEEVSEETYETAPEETSESGYGETLGESTEDNAEPAAEEPAETAYEYEEEPAAAAAAESAEESAETAEEPAEEYASAEEPEEASEEPEEESGEDTEEPDEEDEEEDESEEDEESDEESGEEEEQEDEDDYADRRQEEPARPVTQFIPHTEPAPQRPLTYRDEIRSEIVIKHGNIAAVNCDCVVNATNTTLLGGPGLDNSILKAAGPELLRECAALKGCDVGRAKISGGYRLKAQFVIHTVGPRYSGDETDPVYLTMCYENCLNLAMKYDIRSIAFPAISTGYYGYPLREATLVASRTVRGWMRRHPEYGIKVIFVSADDRTFAMYKDVFKG